jgi:ArsR family transcriptional regulator
MPDDRERRPPGVVRRAAAMLKAAGDPERLRLLDLLLEGSRQVSELADAMDAGLSTTSQRLRILLAEGLVTRERQGRAVFYALSDGHVRDLVANVLDHAEPEHLRDHGHDPVNPPEGREP